MSYTSPSKIALAQLCFARAVAKYVWGYDAEATPESISKQHKLTPLEFTTAQQLFTVFLREKRPAADKRRDWRNAGYDELLYDDISLHAKAEEGKRLHTLIQQYLTTGKVPHTTERAAHKMISVLPVKGGQVAQADVERVVLLDEHHGYQDWMRGAWQGDLKFTVDVKHQRSKDATTDPQRIVYAVDAFNRMPGLVTLKQFWSVAQFDGERALTLRHKWTNDSAYEAYERHVLPTHVKLLAAEKDKPHWQEVEKNQTACDMYPPNGCIMKQHGCRRSIKARLLAIRPKVKNVSR